MVTVCDATVMVAVRAAPEFRLTFSATEPLPEPAAPEATSIQFTPLVAVHAQPSAEVTLTERAPPDASIEIDAGETAYVHAGGVGLGGGGSGVGTRGVGGGGGAGVGIGGVGGGGAGVGTGGGGGVGGVGIGAGGSAPA